MSIGTPLTESGAKVGGGTCSEDSLVITEAGLGMVIRTALAAKARPVASQLSMSKFSELDDSLVTSEVRACWVQMLR